MCVCVSVYTCMRICICIESAVCVCVCVCVYIYIYIYTYIHTYIYCVMYVLRYINTHTVQLKPHTHTHTAWEPTRGKAQEIRHNPVNFVSNYSDTIQLILWVIVTFEILLKSWTFLSKKTITNDLFHSLNTKQWIKLCLHCVKTKQWALERSVNTKHWLMISLHSANTKQWLKLRLHCVNTKPWPQPWGLHGHGHPAGDKSEFQGSKLWTRDSMMGPGTTGLAVSKLWD